MPVVPYIVTHIIAALFLITAWRAPVMTRVVAALGFTVAGGYNIWTAMDSPSSYVAAFGPHALPMYQTFIYGVFARHTAPIVFAISLGQLAVGVSLFAKLRCRKVGYAGAIVFFIAVTPLGIGPAAPSTLIFASGMALMLRFDVKCSAAPADRELAGCS